MLGVKFSCDLFKNVTGLMESPIGPLCVAQKASLTLNKYKTVNFQQFYQCFNRNGEKFSTLLRNQLNPLANVSKTSSNLFIQGGKSFNFYLEFDLEILCFDHDYVWT